ncbi:histidine kinase [Arachnia propionica]|uniref:sensor histidine kinase n=1 Tax=Arachnia propionica TaxID=1750 RepID=UPI00398FFF4B
MSAPQTPVAPRTFMDQVAGTWHTSSEPVWIGAGVIGLFQSFMTYRLLDIKDAGSVLSVPWWVTFTAISITSLLLRRRWPLVTAVTTGLVLLTAGLVLEGAHSYYTFPMLMGVYALASRAGVFACCTGIGTAAACLIIPDALKGGSKAGFVGGMIPSLFVLTAVVAVALTLRARRELLRHRDAELAAQERQSQLTDQRDAARRQTRIAAELHDSVGHDLTAIIALSEGLRDTTGNAALEDAIETINTLAREGLADTRRAVNALHPASPADEFLNATTTRTWDDLDPLLATARRTGLAVASTRTGTPPADPALAGLVFTIVREALTNVMRHAADATRVTVAIDHAPAATTITITDDGRAEGPGVPGHGLANLTRLVTSHGGTLTAGATADGWCLRTVLPKEQP